MVTMVKSLVALVVVSAVLCLYLLSRRIAESSSVATGGGAQRDPAPQKPATLVVRVPADHPIFSRADGTEVATVISARDEDTGEEMNIRFVRRPPPEPVLSRHDDDKDHAPPAVSATAPPPPENLNAVDANDQRQRWVAPHAGIVNTGQYGKKQRNIRAINAPASPATGTTGAEAEAQIANPAAGAAAVGPEGNQFARGFPRDLRAVDISDGRGCRLDRPPQQPAAMDSPRVALQPLNIHRPCVIVSAIFGDVEQSAKQVLPQQLDTNAHYCAKVLFTDNPRFGTTNNMHKWTVVLTPFHLSDPRISEVDLPFRKAKWYKMNFHRVLPPSVEFAVWIDGTVAIKSPNAISWMQHRMYTEAHQDVAATTSPLDEDAVVGSTASAAPLKMASVAALHHAHPGAWFEVLSSVDKYGFGFRTYPSMVVEYATAMIREGFCEGPAIELPKRSETAAPGKRQREKAAANNEEDDDGRSQQQQHDHRRRASAAQLAAMIDYAFMIQCPSYYPFDRLLFPMHSPDARIRDEAIGRAARTVAANFASLMHAVSCKNTTGTSALVSARPPQSAGLTPQQPHAKQPTRSNRLMYTTSIVALDMRNRDTRHFLADWYERSITHLQDQVGFVMSLWKFGIDPVVLNPPDEADVLREFGEHFKFFHHGL